ncbi:MAG: ActS/PrrB/RegB family redox-sensitive histidine kinase [Caulobacterales bacterium]
MTDISIASVLGAPRGEAPLAGTSRVRLRTLIFLRWLAVIGQVLSLLFVRYGLGFELPLGSCLAAITVSACLNVALMVTRSNQALVPDWEAAAQLAYDVLQLAVLLALTGGVQNPFIFLFVAPVAVSAAVLRPSATAGLTALCFISIGALAVWHEPLPWPADQELFLPQLYQIGMTTSVMICLGFTSVYAWRVAAEEERLNLALSAAEAVLAREQKLSALGGLAAAAAHELGTPLATIHLVAKEMARELPPDSPFAEDAQLLMSQSERCRAILTQLSNHGESGDAMHGRAPLKALVDEAAEPPQGLEAEIVISVEAPEGERAPEVRRLPEILHGLGAFIENAVGFADSRVEVIARWTANEIEITVRDDGPGFSPSIIGRLGEPYVSERSENDGQGGLGLGFFIAKTLIERTGARLTVRNRTAPGKGASIRAVWPRIALEAPPL